MIFSKRYSLYANFVGAHPMAGAEKYDIKADKADLYKDAWDWAFIYGANKEELSKAIDSFIKELVAVKKSVIQLEKIFARARTVRQKF